MTGYTRKWKCWICNVEQETIDRPRICVCEDCLLPLATYICANELGVPLFNPGIDGDHFMRKASRLAAVLMGRWQAKR